MSLLIKATSPWLKYFPRFGHPPCEVLSGFEEEGEWAVVTGTAALDSASYKQGSRSLKLSSTDGAITNVEKEVQLNLSHAQFELWIKLDNIDNFQDIALQFEVGASGWGKCFSYWLPASLWRADDNGLWRHFSFGRSCFAKNGGATDADWVNITKIRLRVTAKAGVAFNVNFDELRAVDSPPEGLVTFTFDDGHGSVHDEARPRMDKYGFRGTLGIVTGWVGETNNLTWEEIADMHDMGWDVSSHSHTHPHLDEIDETQLVQELITSQAMLAGKGFYRGSRFFIIPYSDYNQTILDRIREVYLACRSVKPQIETLPCGDPYLLRCKMVGKDTAPATVQGWIDRAKEYREWLILLFHRIVADPYYDTEYDPANFQAILDYLQESSLPVATFSDVFDYALPRVADRTPRARFQQRVMEKDLLPGVHSFTNTDWAAYGDYARQFDSREYDNAEFYFEVMARVSDSAQTLTVALKQGVDFISGSEMTTSSTDTGRLRSGKLSLPDGDVPYKTTWKVTGGTGYLYRSAIRIVQRG